ncbi:MAG TPA: ubiquinol oxidase subunit II [Rhabdochlamydiaceae bacterium]|jgi:cytochrome o ubiquinol oxidase subunit 2
MKTIFKVILLFLLFLGSIALIAYYMSTHHIAVLDPKGAIGVKEADLIITSSLIMLIVVIPVFVMAFFFAWRYREGNTKAAHAPDWEHNYIAEYCWWGVPLIIIAVLAAICWKSSHELNPSRSIESDVKPLSIQVVALQWKWLFLYPEQGIATINFIQFPEKTPIHFEITSDAPMNSFWIPDLGGQIYAMPAMRSQLNLIANEIGSFRGVSANISGKGFAGMTFVAQASSEEDFNKWMQSAQESPQQLTEQIYDQLVEPTENNPIAIYALPNRDLFEYVMMKYMPPQKEMRYTNYEK